VVIAIDRMERGSGAEQHSAVQEVQQKFGMPVISVANLDDLIGFLQGSQELQQHLSAVTQYRAQYGAKET
jgi:orotate phosphoribosyltransferase